MSTITNLAVCNLKKSRIRSILIIISITITTMLLAVIVSFGYGMVESGKVNAGSWYGSYYGTYKGVTEENIEQMQIRSEFTDIGRMAQLGVVEHEMNLTLLWEDETVLSMTNMDKKLTEGSYPERGNEIAAMPSFFQALGIENPKIGDKVTISYRPDLQTPFAPDEFVISGLVAEPDTGIKSKSFSAFVSKDYYENKIPQERRGYKVYFRLSQLQNLTFSNAEDIMKELAVKCGIDELYVSDNAMYLMFMLDPGEEILVGCGAIASIVIVFSMLVIYNIFQVGITQKVQEYGKLKAVGATKRQLKKTVFREGMILAAIGIPIGLITGYGLAVVTFGLMLNQGGMWQSGEEMVSLFNLPLLLMAGLLSFITVWAALKKPMKIVSSISPVEAMRYQERTGKNKGIRKGNKSLNVMGMTMANLSAHRRRTVATIISMGLSCVLFVIIANVAGNMDAEYDARKVMERGEFKISLEYAMTDSAYPENNLDSILTSNPLTDSLIADIEAMGGVTRVDSGSILYSKVRNEDGQWGDRPISVLVLSREDFENQRSEGAALGEFDYDSLTENNGILYGYSYFMESDGFHIGQELDFQLFDGIEQKEWNTQVYGAFGSAGTEFVITEDTFKKLGFMGNNLHRIWVDCEREDLPAVQEALNERLAGLSHIEMERYQDILETVKGQISVIKTGGYILCILIGIISFMNMANTLITSIITRKQEFGVLQAIGMTNSQLNRSLQMEGILFTAGTVLVALLAGIPAGYGLFRYAKATSIAGIHIYHFPTAEIAIMVGLLALLQIVLSFVLSRNVKKESLVERIRYQG